MIQGHYPQNDSKGNGAKDLDSISTARNQAMETNNVEAALKKETSAENQDKKTLEEVLEKRMQERTDDLKEAFKNLELRYKELQEFTFIASHDLREPVRKIQTFGAMIQDRFGELLPEQAVDYFTGMQNAAERMDKLVESLLRYSRISKRGNPFIRADLNELAREAITDVILSKKKRQKLNWGIFLQQK